MAQLLNYCILFLISINGSDCDVKSESDIEPEIDEENAPVDDEFYNKAPESDYDEGSNVERDPEDREWVTTAIRDVAFYLRSHKFNDFDRRYDTPDKPIVKGFVANFPIPPLRTLHWEVRKNCDESFVACLVYLHDKVLLAELKRSDDTTSIIRQRKLDTNKDQSEIKKINEECLKAYNFDYIGGLPFMGPLERFQWRTSASYYMCWYTMRETKDLSMFGEKCDNYARCLDPETGAHNSDVRANDALAFGCAQYSFCPDACCPQRLLRSQEECWASAENPCFSTAHSQRRQCALNRTRNADFVGIVLNQWNTTCNCSQPGFEWDARYRTCIDVDECLTRSHNCDKETQSCFNLPGRYTCGCRWGYLYDDGVGRCLPSPDLGQGFAPEGDLLHRKMPLLRRMHDFADRARNRTREFIGNVKAYFVRSIATAAIPPEILIYYIVSIYILFNVIF